MAEDIASMAMRFWSKVDRRGPDECWTWNAHRDTGGYGIVSLNSRLERAHRVSCALVGNTIPYDRIACHRCNNPACVNPNHVYAGTQSENFQDYMDAGGKNKFRARGIEHPRARLTPDLVRQIRRSSWAQATAIARRIGVTNQCILAVRQGKTWRHVLDLDAPNQKQDNQNEQDQAQSAA